MCVDRGCVVDVEAHGALVDECGRRGELGMRKERRVRDVSLVINWGWVNAVQCFSLSNEWTSPALKAAATGINE